MEQKNSLVEGIINHDIFDKIISLENLFGAWRDFFRGKRNKSDVLIFYQSLEDNLFLIHHDLLKDTWKHGKYQFFRVSDPKPRSIHKATVRDRVLHHALVRILLPIFDRSFIFDSWSCRKGKGTHGSIKRFHQKLEMFSKQNNGPIWILKCDIQKYFQSISHDILLKLLQKKIYDTQLIGILREIIESFSPGIPLGNLTSQLFANIYLNPLDHFIKEKLQIKVYARYSDDFILASSSKENLAYCLMCIEYFLHQKLHLSLHPNKIFLRSFHHGIDWLGYVLYPGYRVLRSKTKKRIKKNIDHRVYDYLNGNYSKESLRCTMESYYGMLQYSWNTSEKDLLFWLERCL